MTEAKEGQFSFTAPVRLTFPYVFEPRPPKPGSTDGQKYDVALWVANDHSDRAELKNKIAQAATIQFPGRNWSRPNLADGSADPAYFPLKWPIADGTRVAEKAKLDKKDLEFYRGGSVLKARRAQKWGPPRLSAVVNGKLIEYDPQNPTVFATAKPYFYHGVYVLAQVSLRGYNGVGGGQDGVACYINMLCSLNEGDHLATQSSAAEVFKGYLGRVTPQNPLGTGHLTFNDAIPY